MSARRRTSTGSLLHISISIYEALDFIQSAVEFRAEQHGDLVGPILPEQSRWSAYLDSIENLRGELEAEEGRP